MNIGEVVEKGERRMVILYLFQGDCAYINFNFQYAYKWSTNINGFLRKPEHTVLFIACPPLCDFVTDELEK